MQLRPPAVIPTPRLDDFVKSFILVTSHSMTPNYSNGSFEFFAYPTQTPTLPTRHLFSPGRPYYDKRSRTKKMAKRRTNEERRSDDFFYFIIVKIFCAT